MFRCAGGCGGNVARDEVFCKGCQWTITHQYRTSVVNRISAQSKNIIGARNGKAELDFISANANATKRQPKIGYTTDPDFFRLAVR